MTNSGPHGLFPTVTATSGSREISQDTSRNSIQTGEVKEYKMPVEKADDPHGGFRCNGTLVYAAGREHGGTS